MVKLTSDSRDVSQDQLSAAENQLLFNTEKLITKKKELLFETQTAARNDLTREIRHCESFNRELFLDFNELVVAKVCHPLPPL